MNKTNENEIKNEIENEGKNEGKNTIAKFFQKSVDASKKVAQSTKEGVSSAFEKAKSVAFMSRMKKLNPVFPQQYESEDFKLPNIIMIVDDAVRKGNKLCEGAVGWLSKDAGVEILCLYDEAVEFSKIKFIPVASCDALYCVDSFDRSRFIRTDCIFSKAHEERIAELKHIAYCLGAKKCSIEINELQTDLRVQNRSFSAKEKVKGIAVRESAETNLKTGGSDIRRGRVVVEFEGNTSCKRPELKWFSYDDNIKRLIEMRIDGSNSIKSETIEISGSSVSTMSQKIAYAIDSVAGTDASLSSQVEKERNSTLVYQVEF